MSLEKYWEKRDFSVTPEPRGKQGRTAATLRSPLRYFIQRHHARALHYDFRLELEGSLKSWAIPKGPSLNPADKRLAVHVEDHPLSYGSFEGSIPAHQYGAGEVVLWDAGYWLPIGDAEQGYTKGHLKFELRGEKLSGTWALVRMGGARQKKEKKENWLLIKEDDDSARTGNDAHITTLRPESVLDKLRSRKQVARPQPEREDTRTLDGIPSVDGAVKKKMPASMMPQLATLVDTAPDSGGWISEIKFDGYRALARIDGKKIQLLSRSGKDWTLKWQAVADALAQLKCSQAWLDGEMVAIDADGNISFQALQNITDEEGGQHGFHLAYYLFDVIYLDGYDLSQMVLIERKLLLKQLLENYHGDRLLYSEHIDAKVADVAKLACRHQMEGIIVKSADAGYRQSRSRSWLKLKCKNRQEFVLGGYTDPAGSREAFGAVLVGTYNDRRELVYAGRVGTGFDGATLQELKRKFSAAEQAHSAFVEPPSGVAAHGVHWLKPLLVAEIEFAQWTGSGTLRHASFIALREDKKPRDIHRENPTKLGSAEEQALSIKGNESEVAGVRLTHSDRVVFAGTGLSKYDLALYYETVQEWILPHLKKRPLTIVRCPQGGEHKCFFQKHADEAIPDGIGRIAVPEGEGTAIYMMANTLEALVALVQIGALELHTWGSHQRVLMKPDRITFDLDPAPGLQWQRTVEAAQLMRGLLTEFGLQSFVKTTGGKGLHVVVPIVPDHGWDEIKAWTRSIADHMADTLPEQFTSNSRKASRDGKIFLDYLRNGQGATAVAAYSPRNRERAPVSTPLFWEELDEGIRSDTFTIKTLPGRLQQLRQDPWQDYFTLKQKISSKMLGLFQRRETA